jgi:uncharacterized membrane protein
MTLLTYISPMIEWLNDSQLATQISESDSLFPWIESFHVLAITAFFGSIAIVDLRLIHIGFIEEPVHQLSQTVLPYTWKAFGIALITGSLLFISKASTYSENTFFLCKMFLLICAGINMLVFQTIIGKNIAAWPAFSKPPVGAKIAGFVSLTLWLSVIICGRWIGFTLVPSLGG